jgi:hypothetical protein
MTSTLKWLAIGLGMLVLTAAAFSQIRRVKDPKYSLDR